MTDRPASAALLAKHSELDQWLRSEWNRPIADCRLYWSDQEPAVSMADHGWMPKERLIMIRVSQKLAPADQLVAICFEVCNAQEFADNDNLVALATEGRITREDYIRQKSEKEFNALLRARNILRDRLPPSNEEVLDTNLYRHLIAAPAAFSDYQIWNSRIPNSNYARTLQFYGQEYDQLRRQKGNMRHP